MYFSSPDNVTPLNKPSNFRCLLLCNLFLFQHFVFEPLKLHKYFLRSFSKWLERLLYSHYFTGYRKEVNFKLFNSDTTDTSETSEKTRRSQLRVLILRLLRFNGGGVWFRENKALSILSAVCYMIIFNFLGYEETILSSNLVCYYVLIPVRPALTLNVCFTYWSTKFIFNNPAPTSKTHCKIKWLILLQEDIALYHEIRIKNIYIYIYSAIKMQG